MGTRKFWSCLTNQFSYGTPTGTSYKINAPAKQAHLFFQVDYHLFSLAHILLKKKGLNRVMVSHIDYFQSIPPQNAYFAGANTPDGFISDYSNFFNEETFTKVYIVKGGSGTGKSTLIRRCAEQAAKHGAECTYILCSSDPESLDGVLLRRDDIHIAVIDGTAPHTVDPVYAGSCGEIVNCGDYWDTSALENARDEIVETVQKKSDCYARAYRYLSGASSVLSASWRLSKNLILQEKLEKCIQRLTAAFKDTGNTGKVINRRTLAVSMNGNVRVSSFNCAKTVVAVKECAAAARIFYDLLENALLAKGLTVFRSISPLGGIAELYLPEQDTAFVPYEDNPDRQRAYTKIMNMQRFVDKEVFSANRQKRRFAEKCFASLMGGATESLAEAKKLHFRLEDIYKATMDFSGLDQFSASLSSSIAKRFQ